MSNEFVQFAQVIQLVSNLYPQITQIAEFKVRLLRIPVSTLGFTISLPATVTPALVAFLFRNGQRFAGEVFDRLAVVLAVN
ncbi:MAG TPA: hypothetical protein VJ875_06885 [Pyrinomonadaceae bacterium]|nr:hypothetical protein [Pyrinomonadaceae bacterium]